MNVFIWEWLLKRALDSSKAHVFAAYQSLFCHDVNLSPNDDAEPDEHMGETLTEKHPASPPGLTSTWKGTP